MPPRNTDNIRKVNEAILRARVALADVEGIFIGDDGASIAALTYFNCVVLLLGHTQEYWRELYEDSLNDLGFAA